jgi:hypothetical protein
MLSSFVSYYGQPGTVIEFAAFQMHYRRLYRDASLRLRTGRPCVNTRSFRLDFDNARWEHPLPGCRFKSIVKGNRQVRLLEFTNDFIEPDWCRKGHAGIVLEGDLEIDFQGRIEQFPQGSALLIPAGDVGAHKARALSERALLFLVEDA